MANTFFLQGKFGTLALAGAAFLCAAAATVCIWGVSDSSAPWPEQAESDLQSDHRAAPKSSQPSLAVAVESAVEQEGSAEVAEVEVVVVPPVSPSAALVASQADAGHSENLPTTVDGGQDGPAGGSQPALVSAPGSAAVSSGDERDSKSPSLSVVEFSSVSNRPRQLARPGRAAPDPAPLVSGDNELETQPQEALRSSPEEATTPTSAAEVAPAPISTEAPGPDEPWTVSIKSVVDFFIGGSHSDPRRRLIGWNLIETGWRSLIDGRVEPYLQAGVTRLMLHNPFGTLPGEPMQLDQYLTALETPGFRMVTTGFVEAWKPIVDRGVEVIAYVGCPRLDDDVQDLLETEGEAAALAYSIRCLQPFLDAGMSVGLDAAAPAEAGSVTHQLAEWLRARGVRVYVEARPPADQTHWFDYPVISTNVFWSRSDPEIHWDSQWGVRNADLREEVLRIHIFDAPPEDWAGTEADYKRKVVREIQDAGDTPIMPAGVGNPPSFIQSLAGDGRESAAFD